MKLTILINYSKIIRKGGEVVKKIFLLLIGMVVVVLFAVGEGQKEPEPTGFTEGEIVYLEGDVFVDGSAAQFGTVIRPGAVIETGGSSLCDVVFGEKNVIRIYENTITELDMYTGRAELKKGSLGAVLYRLTSFISPDGAKFQVSSPDVVAGVRGTALYLKIEDDGQTYFCTCYGKIQLEAPTGKARRTVEAYHHRAYRYITGEDGKVRLERALKEHHDDISMEAIAKRIGEQIEWRDEVEPSSGY